MIPFRFENCETHLIPKCDISVGVSVGGIGSQAG